MTLLACAALVLQFACFGHVVSLPKAPAVLVVSFDGFRYNYFDKNVTPIMETLKLQGTHANYTRNVFPTKTFPNHHSIATGVYPEVHGVLGSKVYDYKYDKPLGYSYELFHYNEDISPIWTLNERANAKGHHSGVMMWPGGELKYQNITPTFSQSYNNSVDWEKRIDTVMSWFLHPQTPANLVFMYLEDPDRHSHVFGPESKETVEQIKKVDNITGYIHKRLQETGLSDIVNVFLLSDHGMDTVTNDTLINLETVINPLVLQEIGNSPVLGLVPKEGSADELYRTLKGLSQNGHFSIYRKNEIPERWHFKHNNRTPPFLVVADEGYGFHDLYFARAYYQQKWNLPDDMNMTFGVHGYDNEEMKMHPFFMAWGPMIKNRYNIPPFDTVDFYSLFSKILGLHPPRTNGSLANVVSMLKNSSSKSVLPLRSGNILIIQISIYLITTFLK